jgi:hypothetical protein
MRTITLLIAVFVSSIAVCQTKPCRYIGYKAIPVDKIIGLDDKVFLCADSTGQLRSNCQLEALSINVDFYSACYNRDSNELRIIGRTSFPSVGIYLSESASKVPIDSQIAETTHCGDISNWGFFEVILKVKTNTFLFFYMGPDPFLVSRYRIGELYQYLRLKAK